MISPRRRQTVLRAGAAVVAGVLYFSPSAHAAALAVDLELVLAVDVSSSMTLEEQRIQRAGYAAAFVDRLVIGAILSGTSRRIAVTYVEWADPGFQRVVVPWRVVDSEASALRFAAALRAAPLQQGVNTSISSALDFAARLIAQSSYRASRRTIDVSGDGPNTSGPPITVVRDRIVADGITINGLPLTLHAAAAGDAPMSPLADYFRDCVIGGPGTFVLPADSTDAIRAAIHRKLVMEIAARTSPFLLVGFGTNRRTTDCMVGQKDFSE